MDKQRYMRLHVYLRSDDRDIEMEIDIPIKVDFNEDDVWLSVGNATQNPKPYNGCLEVSLVTRTMEWPAKLDSDPVSRIKG